MSPERRIWIPNGFEAEGVGEPRRWRLVHGAGGDGLPVVLLPGIEGDARVWAGVVELARDRPVLAIDLPRGTDSLFGMADAVLALPEVARTPRFAVVGASLGGLVARAMAARVPDRVRCVVALGSLPSRDLLPDSVVRAGRVSSLLPSSLWSIAWRRRIRARLYEEGVAPIAADALTAALPNRDEVTRRLAAIEAWGLPAAVGVPALWLRGQTDTEAPWTGADVARVLPDARFETVPGGHRAHLTHPGPFHRTVRAFLAGR